MYSNHEEFKKLGEFGGQFVPEVLMKALIELEEQFDKSKEDEEFQRQQLNVFRMELLGAKVNAVKTGTGTLNDAVVVNVSGRGDKDMHTIANIFKGGELAYHV